MAVPARTDSPVGPTGETPPGPREWRGLFITLVAAFMAVFDLYVVNIATPTLRTELHAGDAAVELVVSGYSFTYAAGLVTGGRLGDRFGYRRMFVTGMAAFTVASLLCALATTPGQLVAARLLQGLTASVMVPQVMSVITVTFPAAHRGRATAWYGAVSGLGALAGQIFGGLLLDADLFGLSWRSIFLVNVPVGVIASALALRVLPRTSAGRRAGFDPIGALAISVALALALVPLSLGRQAGWPVWTWVCLAAAIPAALGAVHWQRVVLRRGRDPILDPRLFRNRPYSLLLGAASTYQLYFGSFLFALTLLVQDRLGSSPTEAALVFLLQGVMFTVASMLGGRLVPRFGMAVPMGGGCLVIVGLLAIAGELAVADGRLAVAWLIPPLAVVGLGNGLLLPPLLGGALAKVRAEHAGSASGMLNTAQQFAGSLGVALIGTVFLSLAGPAMGSGDSAMEVVTVVYVLLTAVVVMLLRRAGAAPLAAGASAGHMTDADDIRQS